MVCDICSKNQASVHLTEIIGGKVTEIHLCEGCAKKKTEEIKKQFSIADFLSELVDIDSQDALNISTTKCSGCGISYQDFKKKGRLGCSQCYEDFKTQLQPLLRKIHGQVRHRGKVLKEKKEMPLEERLAQLRKYLERAIRIEEYEEAARIRDEIKAIERKLKKDLK